MGTPDQVTALWARTAPGGAYAAGLPLDPDKLTRLHQLGSGIAKDISELSATAGLSADGRVVLSGARAIALTLRPLDSMRETLEWLRAVVYLDRTGTREVAEAERTVADSFVALVADVADGTFPERVLGATYASTISELASSAGLGRLALAARASSLDLNGGQGSVPWITLREYGVGLVGAFNASEYQQVLRDAHGIEETIDALEARVLELLEFEADRLLRLSREVGANHPGKPVAPEDVMSSLETHRTSPRNALDLALELTDLALNHIDSELMPLDEADRAVRPEATPAAMVPIVTEGEEYFAGSLTRTPQVHCYVTPGRCGSVYTLVNVLFHELAHCWNMLKSFRASSDLLPPLRVSGPLNTVLVEGIATRREREMLELYAAAPDTSRFARLFDVLGIPRPLALKEFELDTRYWWVARLVRAVFDFRVHPQRQRYVDFVSEMANKTGLSEERISSFCFIFFERPGTAACYATGVRLLDDLAMRSSSRMNTRQFSSRVSSMGLVPPTMWVERLQAVQGTVDP